MLAAALLAAALAIVGWGWATGRSVAARVAAIAGGTSRPRMILGWATGTAVSYGLSALIALLLLGRSDAVATMPDELRRAAWRLALPAEADAALLLWLGGTLLVGMALGAAVLAVQRWRGRGPAGVPYRSPAEARSPAERLPAALLALSAGVSEELFFRLLLPLLIATVTGSAVAGLAIGLAAFAVLHRHQGWLGMSAVAIVGGWLTYLYLLTGTLWVAMIVHALIDVHALVVRPWLWPAGGRTAAVDAPAGA